MDLLNRLDGGRVIAAAVACSLLVLASCGSHNDPTAKPALPAVSTNAEAVPLVLQPLNPAEEVVARRGGGGTKRLTVRSSTITNVYVICDGTSPISVRISTSNSPMMLDVPCDRVVSRRQVYTEKGADVSVLLKGAKAQEWKALITRL